MAIKSLTNLCLLGLCVSLCLSICSFCACFLPSYGSMYLQQHTTSDYPTCQFNSIYWLPGDYPKQRFAYLSLSTLYMHIHLLSSIDVEFFICGDVYVCVSIHTCAYTYVDIYMCVCAYIIIYIHICTQKTHTQAACPEADRGTAGWTGYCKGAAREIVHRKIGGISKMNGTFTEERDRKWW